MSVKKRVGKKIDYAKLEIGTNITNSISDNQYDNIKNMNPIEMKLSSITSIQTFSSDHTNTYPLQCTLMKTPEKSTYASQFTKHLTLLSL